MRGVGQAGVLSDYWLAIGKAVGLGYTGNQGSTACWTLLGAPCVSVAALWGVGGLPTVVQLVGRI